MEAAIAYEVLGLVPGAPWPEVRATYRRLVREHHPDTAADLLEAGVRTVRTAQITEAYAVLRAERHEPDEPRSEAKGPRVAPRDLRDVLDDSVRVLLDADEPEAFSALLEVANLIGVVSYVDRSSGVLEVIVTPVQGEATSLLIDVQGNGDGVTEAALGVEPLGNHRPAPLDPLVDRIATLLASPRPPAPGS